MMIIVALVIGMAMEIEYITIIIITMIVMTVVIVVIDVGTIISTAASPAVVPIGEAICSNSCKNGRIY